MERGAIKRGCNRGEEALVGVGEAMTSGGLADRGKAGSEL
jgi:hypothetical protein